MKSNTVALAAAAVASLAATGPASAQPYGGWNHGPGPGQGHGGPGGNQGPGDGTWDLGRRIEWTQHRIERGAQDGSLDPGEAQRAQSRLNEIRAMVSGSRDRDGGVINPHDRDVLYSRLDQLNDKIRWMRTNDERRPW
jgi:hypothetical protein